MIERILRKRQLLHWPVAGKRIDWELLWEPRDLWVGLFWDERAVQQHWGKERFGHLYIILIPCFPFHVWWYRGYVENA
jgi:hypothetical protein